MRSTLGRKRRPLVPPPPSRRSEAVTTLTEAGARLREKFDQHAIHIATLAANVGIVKDLAFAGAGLEVGYPADLHRTPLHLAVAYGIIPVAQCLLRAGAKVNVTDDLGYTQLYSASYVGHAQCATDLLSFGADMMAVNSDGNSALEACCQEGHVAVVKELVRHGMGFCARPLGARQHGSRSSRSLLRRDTDKPRSRTC